VTNNKLPLFRKGDILRHIEYGFEREVVTVFEEADNTFSYNRTVNKIMPLLFPEDELFNEYDLL
jgi:hypothetical protein